MFKRRRNIKLKSKSRFYDNTRRRIARKTTNSRLLGRRLKQIGIRMGENNQEDEQETEE